MMAALLLAQVATPVPSVTEPDFDALAKAIASCDRATVTKAIGDGTQRHSDALLAAYREQRAITAVRGDLAARRARLRAGERTGDTDAALTLANEALDDREKALADTRALDQSEQELLGYLRGQYLTRCSGKNG